MRWSAATRPCARLSGRPAAGPCRSSATRGPWTYPWSTWRRSGTSEREAEALRLAIEESARPFDLAAGPLFRAALLRLSPEEHFLLVTAHHIVFDGWSRTVLHRELAALYAAFAAGRPTPLAELPIQYADFAVWQREWVQSAALDRQRSYWRQRFRDAPAMIELPSDRPRGSFQTFRGARVRASVPPDVVAGLEALRLAEGATLFTTMLAALKALLLRCTGQDDIAVGIPTAGRGRVETEGLIGFFANTLLLRTDLSGDPAFRELVGRVRATAGGAYAHGDLPFEELVDALQPERDLSRTPLIQVMFAFKNLPGTEGGGDLDEGPPFELAPGLTARPFTVDNGTAKFDLTLYVSQTSRGLALTWQDNTDMFDAATVERLAAHLGTLLREAVADPDRRLSQLPLMSDAEWHLVEVGWNQTERPYAAGRCFHQFFEEQARRAPDALAVECGAERLSYAQLNARANRLAHYLRRRGVEAGTLLGISLPRCAEMAVAVLAVLKAGGAYLPLDPDYPTERLSAMLEDSGAALVVTRTGLHQSGPALLCLDAERQVIAEESDADLDVPIAPDAPAYVIYTSGSTGRPKGVQITHANACHYVQAMRDTLRIESTDRYLHTASFAFSSSVRQLAVPLACGAAVVVVTAEELRDPLALFGLVRRRGVTVIDLVPSYWRSCTRLLESLDEGARADLLSNDLRLVLSASEPLPTDMPGRWAALFGRGARFLNMFGQTETAGIVLVHPIDPSDPGGPASSPSAARSRTRGPTCSTPGCSRSPSGSTASCTSAARASARDTSISPS